MRRIAAAHAVVETWIRAVGSEGWDERRDHPWTRKDLLGHLSAWSDLLLDQIEALQRGHPETITPIDVDAWNAVQVTARRTWTAEQAIGAWERSAQRAMTIISGLPTDTGSRQWRVGWTADPVSIDDVLTLLIVHVEQHRRQLSGDAR